MGRKISPLHYHGDQECTEGHGLGTPDELAHPSMTMDPTIHTKVYVLAETEKEARSMVENEDYSQADCEFHWLSAAEKLPSLGVPEELTLFGFDLVLKPFMEEEDAEVPGEVDEDSGD